MHLLPADRRSLDDEGSAVDLDLAPAEVVLLSFSDGDLAVAAAAWERDRSVLPTLRLANIAKLRHPYSVDLFVAKTASRARLVVVRLLGGLDYWRYGAEELAAAARRHGFALALVPGNCGAAEHFDELSTVPVPELRALAACFEAGGVDNVGAALRRAANHLGAGLDTMPTRSVPPVGLHGPFCRPAPNGADAPHALILFYRSALLAADTAPVEALADALGARGARVSAVYVTSLKDEAAAATLEAWLAAERPDVILNTTAFSAARPEGCVTDRADAPVLQAVLAGADRDSWVADPRGLGAADLAMNVVLPEVDGRILAGAVSFKAEAVAHPDLAFARVVHRPDPERVARVAGRALAWAALRHTPRRARRLACVLSDYPGKGGRAGQAVGLDAPASVQALAAHLGAAGFDCPAPPDPATLMAELTAGAPRPTLTLDQYRDALAELPAAFAAAVTDAWGDPAADPDCRDGAFAHRLGRVGKLVIAVQPDRGRRVDRRTDYHDTALPPRHGYVAFYLWLRHVERVHALIHMGTHGTLEWLPGKAVALGPDCAPDALVGDTPVIYPFLVSNGGEAAQAKRRLGAVTLSHLTPPLVEAGLHGETADLEALFDEYAEAAALDGRRARLLGTAILAKARAGGFALAVAPDAGPEVTLAALDAWLCDLKEARIGDGLHVLGHPPEDADSAVAACGPAELDAIVRALDGRFVPPGPSGAPGAGRADVLPTGRNMVAVDPRAVPTRTGWEIGFRMADELVTRHAQDHGEWPRRIVLDLWASGTMRTGGVDLAQAMALIGTKPVWDHASNRVTGYEILPLARLGRSRVDATLRISGLFRDTFPEQIALYDAAVRAVAALDEADDDNPLAAASRADGPPRRVFGAAPGAYGTGLGPVLAADGWEGADELGDAYLAATTHSYGRGGAGRPDAAGFATQVAAADAFTHTGDLPGEDALSSDVFAAHEGGFAAAARRLGGAPALYRADATRPDQPRLRTLAADLERALLARAANPRWIAGQMRHGWAGAAALAETLDALYGFAATTDAVPSGHFDRLFDATLGDDAVRAFLQGANPAAAAGMAARFASAIRRGFWLCRRNSTLAVLADAGAAPAAVAA